MQHHDRNDRKSVQVVDPTHIVSPQEYASRCATEPHILLDVRERVQFDICSLGGAQNVPLRQLVANKEHFLESLETANLPVYVICRRGIDSQTGAQALIQHGLPSVYHIQGGLHAYAESVDPSFPVY